MRVIAIIQARMGSTRLPGKVLRDIGGKTMLARVVRRAQRASLLDKVVVATTVMPADNAIEHLCDSKGWSYFRGSENDVLDRYYQTAMTYQADVVVRITSDCPLIDPEIIDRALQTFLVEQPQTDYVANVLPQRTYPRGLDLEVMSFTALSQAWHEDKNPAWREHVTPYIYRNPNLFKLQGVMNEVDHSDMRWTVDTPEDLAFVCRIYEHFAHDHFSWREVLTLLEEYPEWLQINQHVPQKVV